MHGRIQRPAERPSTLYNSGRRDNRLYGEGCTGSGGTLRDVVSG